MRKTLFKFLAILAIASPLALTACHGGDEHPGDGAGGSNTSEHPSGGGSEHPN